MKEWKECLNPKCKKVSEETEKRLAAVTGNATEKRLAAVTGNADEIQHNLWFLKESLDKDFLMDYDGYLRLQTLSALANKIYNEVCDLYNLVYEKDLL